jgi:hypothetical protein
MLYWTVREKDDQNERLGLFFDLTWVVYQLSLVDCLGCGHGQYAIANL